MATARLIRMSRALGVNQTHDPVSTTRCISSSMASKQRTAQMCMSSATGGGERNSMAIKAVNCASECSQVSDTKTDQEIDFGLLLAHVSEWASCWIKLITKERRTKRLRLNIQAFVEKGIMNCRFFTLLAIGGTLLASVLCFVEGCLLILESYSHYLHELPQVSEHFLPLLIEATDMFLLGTAMLTFGNALRFMFMGGQQNLRGNRSEHSGTSQTFPLPWNGVQSAIQAKLKIGHAIIMILQVQMVEKFKSVPVTTGLDFAFLAGALFLSSASMFILSRMNAARPEEGKSRQGISEEANK